MLTDVVSRDIPTANHQVRRIDHWHVNNVNAIMWYSLDDSPVLVKDNNTFMILKCVKSFLSVPASWVANTTAWNRGMIAVMWCCMWQLCDLWSHCNLYAATFTPHWSFVRHASCMASTDQEKSEVGRPKIYHVCNLFCTDKVELIGLLYELSLVKPF